jgi:asparagine synthase (glutamine-hydrolysing)
VCGIAGVFSAHLEPRHDAAVAGIVERQHDRGPDAKTVLRIAGTSVGAILGHNRLSIIDLTATGNQPMWDVDHAVCVVFNGEIYNYVELREQLVALGQRFRGTSDTEVLLEAFKQWGPEAFQRLNGMFAFGLFDACDETMYLVRDRFGVKPLYLAEHQGDLYFASTPRPLADALALGVDLDYVARGVRYGLYEHDETAPYHAMRALAPAHWLRARRPRRGMLEIDLHPYYDLDTNVRALTDSLASISVKEATTRLDSLLDDAVRIRLRSDVPVAVSLSGGLDSSSVAALAAYHPNERLHGFTFGHPDAPQSEGPLVRGFSAKAGIDVTFIWPTVDEICEAYPRVVKAQTGPFPSATIISQNLVFRRCRADGFKVLLGGQGGDEAFMGYHKFKVFYFRHLVRRRCYAKALGYAASLLPTVMAERGLWSDTWRARDRYLRSSGLPSMLRLPDSQMGIGYSPSDPLWTRQATDVKSASLPTLLRYEDSNSMGNSVESRLPFVDHRVVEFGLALPDSLKLRAGRGKWIVRHTLGDRLPRDIRDARYKIGFEVQQAEWIDGGLGDTIRTNLRERLDRCAPYLQPGARIDDLFANERLKFAPNAFAEATALLWLAYHPGEGDRPA